jgi:hypothetical protein
VKFSGAAVFVQFKTFQGCGHFSQEPITQDLGMFGWQLVDQGNAEQNKDVEFCLLF